MTAAPAGPSASATRPLASIVGGVWLRTVTSKLVAPTLWAASWALQLTFDLPNASSDSATGEQMQVPAARQAANVAGSGVTSSVAVSSGANQTVAPPLPHTGVGSRPGVV